MPTKMLGEARQSIRSMRVLSLLSGTLVLLFVSVRTRCAERRPMRAAAPIFKSPVEVIPSGRSSTEH